MKTYGESERAPRTTFSAVKHTHEKVSDHWEPKEKGTFGRAVDAIRKAK